MRLQMLGVGILAAVCAAACGGGGSESGAGSTAAPVTTGTGPKVDAATAGEVKGTVVIEGAAPANALIKMAADPVCARENTGEQKQETFTIGSDGKSLANVFVYVKDGLGNFSYDVPGDPIVLTQKGCRYSPHVFGLQVGQKLQVVNEDPTLHNIHASPTANGEFNFGQSLQGQKNFTPRPFTVKEVMVPFKCDVHGWMNAYVGVLDHPYFAVTTTDGTFSLKTLPPGTYTIEAWHEKLGTTTQTVTVGDKETKTVDFVFKAPAAAN
jgi:plastocyanin